MRIWVEAQNNLTFSLQEIENTGRPNIHMENMKRREKLSSIDQTS
jgi:hypothetical protein